MFYRIFIEKSVWNFLYFWLLFSPFPSTDCFPIGSPKCVFETWLCNSFLLLYVSIRFSLLSNWGLWLLIFQFIPYVVRSYVDWLHISRLSYFVDFVLVQKGTIESIWVFGRLCQHSTVLVGSSNSVSGGFIQIFRMILKVYFMSSPFLLVFFCL